MVTLLWFVFVPLAAVVFGWSIERQCRIERAPNVWLIDWSAWGAGLAFVGVVLYQVLVLALDLPPMESAPAVGYAGQGAARVQLFLVAMVCCGGVGTSLAAWLWLGPWRAMPPWAWWQWGFPLLGLAGGTALVICVAPLAPGGLYTQAYWKHRGYGATFENRALTELRSNGRYGGIDRRAAIPLMAKLADLEVVEIGDEVNPTDDDLRYLARLPKLRKLSLISCRRITDTGIEHLRGHPALEELDLGGTAVTDACIPTLLSMPRLRELNDNSGNVGVGMSTEAAYKLYDELQKRPRPGP